MLASIQIRATLVDLDRDYVAERDPGRAVFFAKLALIELCGWTEEAMDQLVLDCATRCSLSADKMRHLESQIIKRTHGFDYEPHFRHMLTAVIGLRAFQVVENSLDLRKPATLPAFRGSLDTLKPTRNSSAHTHLIRAPMLGRPMTTINAPSVTGAHLTHIETGLKEFEQELRRRRL